MESKMRELWQGKGYPKGFPIGQGEGAKEQNINLFPFPIAP